MSIKARIGAWAALCLLVCSAAAQASGARASLDRDHVALGDTVTLTLTFPGASSAATPDLKPLTRDFRIQDQSTQSSFSSVNGSVSTTYTIQLVLQPRHTGTLHIPALEAGGQRTQALALKVDPPSPHARGKPGDAAFLAVTLNTHTPYVGEQVALDVRLFYTGALTNGSLPDPAVDGADVRRLGREQRYRTTRDGTSYFVVERHYALVPKHAGKLVLPPVVFRGQAVNQRSMGSFFGNVRQVGAQSSAETLTVKPRPASTAGGPWLPARQVELNLGGLPASGKVQVGEPVTVTVQAGATGLAASDLPEPSLPGLSGADIYPDQPQDVTRNNGQWITGSRTRTFAIVPNRSGTLHIPPITLKWWNVVSDREETARVPAHTLTVVAAGGSAPGPAHPASVAPAPAASASLQAMPVQTPSPAGPRAAKAVSTGSTPWRLIALGSGLLWLLSVAVVLVWWLWTRRGRTPRGGPDRTSEAQGRARTLRNAFLVAARRDDLRAAGHALLAWARAERPAVEHLQALAALLQDESQRGAIAELERALYAVDTPSAGVGHRLADAFGKGMSWRVDETATAQDDLPPLYPRR